MRLQASTVGRGIVLISLLTGLGACSDSPALDAVAPSLQAAEIPHIDSTPVSAVYLDTARAIAVAELKAAHDGRTARGVEDVILVIENALPGFGGLYLDETGTLVAYGPPALSSDSVRTALATLAPTLNLLPDERGMLVAGTIRVLPSRYPFSMLVAWREMVARYATADLGIVSIDADEKSNVVQIGIRSTETLQKTLQFAHDIGIPAGAALVSQMDEARI